MPSAIEISELRIDYDDFTAVRDVSLNIPAGSVYGLVGPNGAGKTSILRVLATLQHPTYGSVKIQGTDIFEHPEKVRQKLSYMPDLAPTIPDLRVWEFIDYFAHAYGVPKAERADKVQSVLEQVDLWDKKDILCETLSRGMTQRVVLAKSLIHDPEILLLDEPASGMDPIARLDLRNIIRSLSKQGVTVLVSSHILTELAEMCSDVAILHLGLLRADGSVEAVVNKFAKRGNRISIRFLENVDKAKDWLNNDERISELNEDETGIHFLFAGDKQAQAGLLKDLCINEFLITEFQAERIGLEGVLQDVYGSRRKQAEEVANA